MQETLVRFLDWEDPLEKGQATHSSILRLPLWLSWWRIHLQCRRPGFDPWVGKIPWRKERLPTPVFWPGEFHGLYSSWVVKSQTWLSNFHFLGEDWGVERVWQLPLHKSRELSSLLWTKEETWDKKGLPLTFTLVFRSEGDDLIFPSPKSVFIPLASCYYSLTRSFNCFLQVAGGITTAPHWTPSASSNYSCLPLEQHHMPEWGL